MSRTLAVFVESLENRQLLDGSPTDKSHPDEQPAPALDLVTGLGESFTTDSGLVVASVGGGITTVPSGDRRAPLGKPASLTVPNLIGQWTGKAKAKVLIFTRSVGFSMRITGQTNTSVTGTITVAGKSFKGTIPVTWNGRNFSMNYSDSKSKVSGKLSGTVSTNGKTMTGKISGSGYSVSLKGDVSATKTA